MIRIKPHHFVDIVRDYGKGIKEYTPHPYGHALHIIAKKILGDLDIIIQIELGIDDICEPCIHNVNGVCDDLIDTSFRPQAPESKNEWNLLIDKRWCNVLNIKQEDLIGIKELCKRIKNCSYSDIKNIYRELPENMIVEREKNIKKGLELILNKKF
ncbi:MAG TPA: hypothetical protein PKV21_04655 [bacterium]|nr:hypothetical protein [bacterium]HOM26779.1 hypothetical protein [bacterium]